MTNRTSRRYPEVIDIIPIRFVSPVQNDALLREKYLNQGLSTAQIARELGVSRSSVSDRIGRLGISKPRRRPSYLLSQIPFGWRASNGRLVPHAAERKVLAQMANWRNEGLSLREIASRLTTSNVRTKNGGRWQARTVSRILDRFTKSQNEQ